MRVRSAAVQNGKMETDWWGGFLFLPEKYIPVLGLTGIVLGCVADVVVVKGWVQKGFLIHKSGLIVFGGIGLIISQYWITRKTNLFILKRNRI